MRLLRVHKFEGSKMECVGMAREHSFPSRHGAPHFEVAMADTHLVNNNGMSAPSRTITLLVTDLTPETFAPYGQVIDVQSDGDSFGPNDAQLYLSRGIPRFYLMRLKDRALSFDRITHHANTTQCLGSLNGKTWYLGVIPSTIVDENEYLPPAVEDARVFRVEGPRYLKLHRGTWHAGPLFEEEPYMDFYNLELSNTNEVDHPTYNFKKCKGVVFEVEKL